MAHPYEEVLLTIVIPAYNEEARLERSLEQVVLFVTQQSYSIEVIVVNNNSQDSTPHIAEDFARRYPFIRAVNEYQQGKGAAVRTGMLQGSGKYLIFCDADFSMPVEEIAKFVPPALADYDIAIASRELTGSRRIGEPEYRHLMGRIYNFIVRVLAIPRIQDTQCGFKSFRREVAFHLFPLQTIDGWGFDVELLFIALQHGYRIVEVPITWHYFAQSRINPIRSSIEMFIEVFKVRLNGWQGRYDAQSDQVTK